MSRLSYDRFFFFNDTATTEIYTLSLHDALPISMFTAIGVPGSSIYTASKAALESLARSLSAELVGRGIRVRSEEHTSELQSRQYLVCRLLLEKKKQSQFYS